MDFENRRGNVTTHSGFNGPVAHLIGFILSIGVILVTIVLSIFIVFSFIQDKKIEDYILREAEVIEKEDEANYKVSYVIDGKIYESVVFAISDYEKGSHFDILVNPSDLSDIYYKDNSDAGSTLIFFLVLLFALFTGVSSCRNHLNNFLHYVNPNKYVYRQPKSHIELGNGDLPSDTDIFDQGGDYSKWRF